MISYRILDMKVQHIKALSEIEKQCFSVPWSEKSLVEELENKAAKFFVAESDNDVLAYVGMHVISDEAYIANLAVKVDYRRMGIGTSLINHTLNFAKKNKLKFLTLEVRESNLSAIRLYKSLGFKNVGKRKNFYNKPTEDGEIFTYFFS